MLRSRSNRHISRGNRSGRERFAVVITDECCGCLPLHKLIFIHDINQKVPIVLRPKERSALKGGTHFHARVFTRFAVGDDFRHHRIVERGDFIPGLDTRVDANALTRGLIKEFDITRAGQETSSGIFSIEPDLDCEAEELNIFLLRWKRLAPCNTNLPLNKVVACDHLGHWMLNLKTRIHLQEIELTGLIE